MDVNNHPLDLALSDIFENLQIWMMRMKRESYNRGLEDAASIVFKSRIKGKYAAIEEIVYEIKKLKY